MPCFCFPCFTPLQPCRPSWTLQVSSCYKDIFLAIPSIIHGKLPPEMSTANTICCVFPPMPLYKWGLTRAHYSKASPFHPLTSQSAWPYCIFFPTQHLTLSNIPNLLIFLFHLQIYLFMTCLFPLKYKVLEDRNVWLFCALVYSK